MDRPVDPLLALADRCVHCGLCLPACPTYRMEGLEAESARGRIALAKAFVLGTIEPTATGDDHLDNCLACRNCETVCPAGVEFGALLVEARARQRQRRGPGWRQRLLEWLVARPRMLDAVLALYRFAWPLLPRRLRLLPRPPVGAALAPRPILWERPLAAIARKARSHKGNRGASAAPTVALFRGCIAGSYEAGLRDATIRLCAATGVELVQPAEQTCCGAVHAHAGDLDGARVLGDRNRVAFAGATTVLTLASGCHESLEEGLAGRAEVVDAISFLLARADALQFRPHVERVALHLPCTQRNVVRSDAATRTLLARVPGLEVVVLDAGFGCCGAAGTRMATDPDGAARYRQPLLDQLQASGATRLLSANIGCRLHFANGTEMPVQHPLEFLAEAAL